MVKGLRRPTPKDIVFLNHADHVRLWKLVEGAVADAFISHPDFLTDKGRATVVRSVTKRVVGQLVDHAKRTLRGGRFCDCQCRGASNKAPDDSSAVAKARANGADDSTVSPDPIPGPATEGRPPE
jgi:hypothetical protein